MNATISLKERSLAYIEKWKANGGKVGSYVCPACKSLLTTIVPDKKKEVWDSTTECYECGDIHFVTKTIAGITVSVLNEEENND